MTSQTAPDPRLADTLTRARPRLVQAILTGAHSGTAKPNRFNESPERLAERVGQWLDLLIGAAAGKTGYRALTAGQVSFEVSRPELDQDENAARLAQALDGLHQDLEGCLAETDAAAGPALKTLLTEVFSGLRTPCDAYVDTLLIGDCLMGEIASIAADTTRRAGVGFNAFPINARTPEQLKALISQLGDRRYKAIFFSPFSHARCPEIEALLNPRLAAASRAKIEALAEQVIAQTGPMINALAQTYDCPIYLHTAGLVARGNTAFKCAARERVMRRQTGIARKRIDTWLRDHVAALNQSLGRRIQLIDETAQASRLGAARAGLLLHDSDIQHATHLSFALAQDYADRIVMLARLHGRKLMICDLDNTLWDGVIGEGAVRPFLDRQQILRRLKTNSGVVLSIASKNDPAKVHFRDNVLSEADFVAPQINWGFKTQSVGTICTTLNLQKRHTVFVDDRGDERALVKSDHPDVEVLDATDAAVWGRISLWADLIENSSDMDRTALYQAQASRSQFVEQLGTADVAQADAALLSKLDLKIDVRQAKGADVKRAAELINRTNQWNTCGSRTSEAELKDYLAEESVLVMIASAEDRFGKMGDVCAAVVTEIHTEPTIWMFVLSCRVFGYGVETAMIEAIQEAVGFGDRTHKLSGLYTPTDQNHMARNMYPDHGFTPAANGRFELLAPGMLNLKAVTA